MFQFLNESLIWVSATASLITGALSVAEDYPPAYVLVFAVTTVLGGLLLQQRRVIAVIQTSLDSEVARCNGLEQSLNALRREFTEYIHEQLPPPPSH